MNETLRIACLQTSAGSELDVNLAAAKARVREAAAGGASLLFLPEYFSCLHLNGAYLNLAPHREAEHPALAAMRELAAELQVWIQMGSIAVCAPDGGLHNRAILLDASGGIVARYNKIHLFDVDLAQGESYRESDQISPGDSVVLAQTPWGGLGISVCYDLRFPHLYRALAKAGAVMLCVPAAFTYTTGKAHWHTLVRARAIENGCYVIAACQTGMHGDARSFGHSLVVDPWGAVLLDGSEDEGVFFAELDLKTVAETRNRIPSLRHDRPYRGP